MTLCLCGKTALLKVVKAHHVTISPAAPQGVCGVCRLSLGTGPCMPGQPWGHQGDNTAHASKGAQVSLGTDGQLN